MKRLLITGMVLFLVLLLISLGVVPIYAHRDPVPLYDGDWATMEVWRPPMSDALPAYATMDDSSLAYGHNHYSGKWTGHTDRLLTVGSTRRAVFEWGLGLVLVLLLFGFLPYVLGLMMKRLNIHVLEDDEPTWMEGFMTMVMVLSVVTLGVLIPYLVGWGVLLLFGG